MWRESVSGSMGSAGVGRKGTSELGDRRQETWKSVFFAETVSGDLKHGREDKSLPKHLELTHPKRMANYSSTPSHTL